MFPARHMVRAVRLAVLSLLLWLGLMPASAQIYSTAQGGTQYKGTYEEAYGSMNDGYYGSMEAQYEYNPYQSNVYKPGSSTPNTGLRKHHLSVQTPWSDSYAPMRTKKNSPTGEPGGAVGEDNKSENDPEGETGAPDGFITPSDPGHQSNQSPVGEVWVLLFFAAAAALVVFIRQKREKRHIAIYSEVQQPSDKSNMKQHIRKSLFISIILLAGVSNAWAWTSRQTGTIYSVYVTGSMNSWNTNNNNWKLSSIDANHWKGTFYLKGQSSNYTFKLYINAKNRNDYYSTGYNYHKDWTGGEAPIYTDKGDASITPRTTTNTKYIKVEIDFYASYGSDDHGYLSVTQTDVSDLSPSLNASLTNIIAAETSTLTASCSGGSGDYTYSYKVTCDGKDATSTLSAISGTSVTFTAPKEVTKKTYTITVTAKDTHALLNDLSTKTATKDITVAAFVPTTIYLKPNSNWKEANARFAIYYWRGSNDSWVEMEDVGCNGDYYTATIPAGFTDFKFVRLNPSNFKLDWSNRWNDTENQIILEDKNLFKINDNDWGNTSNGGTGAGGSWSTYSAPTYNITTNTPIGGTISVSPASPVAVNTSVTVTMIPNPGYKFREGSIKIGSKEKESINTATTTRPICGPTEINAEFVTAGEQVVYLKPTNNWNFDSPTFAVHVWNNDGDATAKDIPMTPADCNGDYYTATIPAGYHSMVFYRKNTAGNDVWNKTADLVIPVNNNNCYTITSTGSGQDTPAACSWGTFAPTYDVQVNITGQGTITINGTEYSTNTTINNVALNNDLNIGAITPANRWACTNATIKIGKEEQKKLLANSTQNICGPTTINLTFEQTSCKITFDLHLPVGVDNESMMIDPQYVAPGEKAVKPSLREINDYLFGGWYKDKNCTQIYDFDAPVNQDITIHAKWVLYSQCIFFKNNLKWDDVYIYTFSDEVWHANGTDDPSDDKGVQPKVNRIDFGQMIQIGESDIYYHILNSAQGFCRIAFSKDNMSNYDYFHNSKAIYRSDRFDQLPLYIPLTGQTAVVHNNTEYYNDGIWMKYNSKESGYYWSGKTGDSDWSDHALTADLTGIYSFSTTITLTAGTDYQFKISNIGKDADNPSIKATAWYGNSGKMDANNHTGWHFSTINKDNATITPTVSGDYTVIVHLDEGKVMVSLEYPLLVDDYRLAYSDDSTGFHPGHYIKHNSRKAEVLDTISFFVHHTKNPRIWLQQCTNIDNQGNETWETRKTYAASTLANDGDNPNAAMLPGKKKSDANLVIGIESCNINKTGVFNFVLQQTNNNEHDADLAIAQIHEYTGDFYIRTDIAGGGWKSFRNASNQMTYSTYADAHENFSHYFCEWILKDVNVKFTIANDYSYCISDTLDSDEFISKNGTSVGCLPENANVRFGWNQDDNLITRAYIRGSTNVADRFLVITGNDELKNANGDILEEGGEGSPRYGLLNNEEIFDDMNNWIYQTDVTANTNTLIKLVADYNDQTQYFKGSNEAMIPLLTSSSETRTYKIRLIYDFKTNHLVVAWLPDQDIDENLELETDLMLIRRNHGQATQIQFNPKEKTISSLKTAYGVTTFEKSFLTNNSKTQEERLLYWVSFPFDVRLKDVFGFGEYGTHWIMEYYDGESRAQNGLWADTDTYWKYITNPNYTLKAGTGYVLCLSTGLLNSSHSIYGHNVTEISLYFPSKSELQEISGTPTTTIAPEHTCTITRENRNIYDSNWNLIGIPGYADIANVKVGSSAHKDLEDPSVTAECASFYYMYLPETNTYDATENTLENNFQILHSYMIQYAGEINWTKAPSVTPFSIAARRTGNMPSEHTLRLELAQGENKADQTIIKLQEQDATADFDMNIDMTKIKNSGANIYTLTENTAIMVAGNALPMEKTTIPVGIEVANAGTYTLRMPDGTDGISVTLIDNLTGIHTDMLLGEYTVTLDAGSHLNRFYIAVDPDRTATAVENVGEEAKGKGVKYLIDGQLFIRTAEGIFDARGQRL